MNPAALMAALRGDIDNALIASTPGGIERQEAEGQRMLVASTTIPKKIIGATRAQLIEIGFKFGEDADDLFVHCELPKGWKKVATGHSMHSHVLDEQSRKRAGIFYKAAFYDRHADITMLSRYTLRVFRKPAMEIEAEVCAVVDTDAILFETEVYESADYMAYDAARMLCRLWLDDKYPDWQSPLAYW